MSGDSLGCHNLGKGCYWHLMSRDRAAIKHPAWAATNKESSTPIYQNVKSAAIWEEEVYTVLFPDYVGFSLENLIKSVFLSHSCSWHKFLRCMLMIFPFLEWMCLYRCKEWLLGDLLAGISVGIVQVPQGKEDSKPFHL